MKKVLVTGSKGQLGSEFRSQAVNHPDTDFVFTDMEELDLADFAAVRSFLKNGNFDFCINCAAYTDVDQAEENVEKAFLINADAVENLAEACETNHTKLVHISTDYVFDGTASRPYKEDDPVSPQSVYGLSKLKGEQAVLAHSSEAVIIRTAWLCSRFGKNFVKTIRRLAAERNVISVVDDQWGSPTFTEDLAKAILQIISAEKKVQGNQIYHYTSEGRISWYIFAREIVELSGLSSVVKPVKSVEYPTKAKRPAYSVLDTEKIQKDYGLQIPAWKASLKKLINHLKQEETNDQS